MLQKSLASMIRLVLLKRKKGASFFISSGNALDMISNNIEQAFIKGNEIDLNNHQKSCILNIKSDI